MTRSMRFLHTAAVLCACLLVSAGAARAQGAAGPVMLVAKPGIGAIFSETVMVAMPAENSEHVGFIINRPLHRTLGSLFPEHQAASKVADPVRFGGPEMTDTIFAIARSRADAGGETQPLFGDLVVATRADVIDRIIERTPNDARYFIGFVRWGAGELETEIANGFWYVIEAQGDLMFRKDAHGMWQELVRRLGIEPRTPGGSAV